MRTITEIESSLIERAPSLSSSSAAEWRIWVSIFAYAIWLFEAIMDAFKADIETQIEKKQPGTLEWYRDTALAFQNGHTLAVDQWGVVGYATDDASARIVKHASVSESNGGLVLKVAGINEETQELQPLNIGAGEFINFQRYMEKVKFAGTAIDYRTLSPDTVEYDVTVYFDTLYLESDVQTNILAALDDFRSNLSFDAKLYSSAFMNAILGVEGVVTAKINGLEVTPAPINGVPQATVAVDVVTELASGYFNWSDDSTLTLSTL